MKNKVEPIRILQIVPGGHVCGGIENYIMNYYRNLDTTKIQFDFLVHYKEKGYFDEEILKLGGKIYYTNVRKDKNIVKYIIFLFNFFKNHKEYKIIHGHMPGLAPIYLFMAKINGVKVRIVHSHATDTERTIKGNILKLIIKMIKYFSNVYFACSEEAGKFMFGKRKFFVIKNAIDFEKFVFNKEKRIEIREKLNLNNSFVIGCVARFNKQKNHEFLLDIFSEVLKEKKNAKLLLIGEGPLEKQIKEKAIKLEIIDKIIFLGVTENVNYYYNTFDAFVLPSNFEGLPIVIIESQVNGLSVFISDSVSKEAKISDLVYFISLKESARYWAKMIITNNIRKDEKNCISKSGYDIKKSVKILENKYLQLYKGEYNERKY